MNRKRFKTYDRVMPRVFNSSRSSLRSNSVVMRHEVPSSVRTLGGKASGSNLSCSGFSELPIVLNEYVEEESPKKSEPSRRSKVLKPKKTIRSLDTSKSPPRAVTKAVVSSRSLGAQQSTPVLSREEQWSDAHYRKCLSSRSHIRLRELKDEIRAYHETEKLMRLRSKLYKKCGVVFDENGYIASDKAVQAEVQIEKEPEIIRRKTWVEIIGRPDLLTTQTKSASHFLCSLHFDKSMIRYIPQLKADAVPTKSVQNQPNSSNHNINEDCKNVSTQTNESSINVLSAVTFKGPDKKSSCVQTTSDDTNDNTTKTAQALSSDTPRKRKLRGDYKKSEIKEEAPT